MWYAWHDVTPVFYSIELWAHLKWEIIIIVKKNLWNPLEKIAKNHLSTCVGIRKVRI